MKLLDVFAIINEAQFLIERDVMNAKELKQWAAETSERVTDPQAKTWYTSQLFKFLINRYEAGARQAQVDDNSPDWMVAKAQAGDPIITVEPQEQLRQQAGQVIDWLNAQTAENESPNLRMTWEEAVEAQHQWHRDIARQSRVTELTADQMLGIVTIMEFPDGFRWVDVQTEVCLQHEGTVMGHCVGQGGYTQGVQAGTTKILSLRDGNNNPHATIEGNSEKPIHINAAMLNSGQADLFLDNALEQSFIDLSITQIKGKENKPVVRKYRDYVQDFLTKFQINEFGYMGLSDLENCGLFKRREGGYANVEEIGEHMAKMEDGSVWHRVTSKEAVLDSYAGSLDAKWMLFDKTGRSVGNMSEEHMGVINRISFDSNLGYNMTTAEKEKYKDHITAAFGTGEVRPDGALFGGFYNSLEGFGLAVAHQKVNEPQTIGKLRVKTNAGDVFGSEWGGNGNMYWLMHGDVIKSRFVIQQSLAEGGYKLTFDNNRGIPSGSMPTFLKEVEDTFDSDLHIDTIQLDDRIIMVNDMTWEPDSKSELIMEEDGVKFYSTQSDDSLPQWYNAVDSVGHHIFNMSIDQTNFKVRMVNDVKVAGYYAVYLIEHLEADIGEYGDFSSFARELLEETKWFSSENSNSWYVEDNQFPIHMTTTFDYDDGTEEEEYNDDTVMQTYLSETQMNDYGFEADHMAREYEQVYRGAFTGWDDEHQPDEADDDGRTHVKTTWSVEGIGVESTVTHPISGGSVRISK